MMSSLTVNPLYSWWCHYYLVGLSCQQNQRTLGKEYKIKQNHHHIHTRQTVADNNNTLTNKVLLNKYILYLIVQYGVKNVLQLLLSLHTVHCVYICMYIQGIPYFLPQAATFTGQARTVGQSCRPHTYLPLHAYYLHWILWLTIQRSHMPSLMSLLLRLYCILQNLVIC